jgi:hypothetical protein
MNDFAGSLVPVLTPSQPVFTANPKVRNTSDSSRLEESLDKPGGADHEDGPQKYKDNSGGTTE